MKLSVILPDNDVAVLDQYAMEHGYQSRSAVLRKALRSLRAVELEAAYESAWTEWTASGDGDLWETVAVDR